MAVWHRGKHLCTNNSLPGTMLSLQYNLKIDSAYPAFLKGKKDWNIFQKDYYPTSSTPQKTNLHRSHVPSSRSWPLESSCIECWQTGPHLYSWSDCPIFSVSQVLEEGPKFLKGRAFIFPLLASLIIGIYSSTKFSSRKSHCLFDESPPTFPHPSIHMVQRKLSEDTD